MAKKSKTSAGGSALGSVLSRIRGAPSSTGTSQAGTTTGAPSGVKKSMKKASKKVGTPQVEQGESTKPVGVPIITPTSTSTSPAVRGTTTSATSTSTASSSSSRRASSSTTKPDSSSTPIATASKNQQVAKPASIDDIFASAPKKSAMQLAAEEAVKSKKVKKGLAKKNKMKGATASTDPSTSTAQESSKNLQGASADDLFGNESARWRNDGLGGIYDHDGWTNRKMRDGNTKIYKAHLIEEKDRPGAGTTPQCPFDCDCCFGFAGDEMEDFLDTCAKKGKYVEK
ncbi:unnamed protein product [Amoebophrya sp. A25]|nr:unnamed protein product [Amoebophrya sp. A25]|eukprot:GSA25T00012853001.1